MFINPDFIVFTKIQNSRNIPFNSEEHFKMEYSLEIQFISNVHYFEPIRVTCTGKINKLTNLLELTSALITIQRHIILDHVHAGFGKGCAEGLMEVKVKCPIFREYIKCVCSTTKFNIIKCLCSITKFYPINIQEGPKYYYPQAPSSATTGGYNFQLGVWERCKQRSSQTI